MAATNSNLIDRVITWVAPTWGAERMAARLAMDEAGRLMNSYRGGVTTRLDTNVPASQGMSGINHPLRGPTLTKLRDRSRNLDRNNCLASSLLDRATENVIGTGLRLQCRSSDPVWNKAAEALFENWVDQCDVRDLQSFYDIQQLTYRTFLREGDVGCVLADRGDGWPILQPIEGDRIESKPGKENVAIDGIEWSKTGKASKFWIKNSADVFGQKADYEPVQARDFIYLMRQKRFSQVRGEPIFASTFWLFDHVDGYVEAVVTSARAGACQALLIKKNGAANAYGNLKGSTNPTTGKNERKIGLQPLQALFLEPGEEAQGFNPTQPTQNFPDSLRALSRLMGLNLGLTLEQVMLDFSQTNFSSSRAARIQADATANSEREKFVRRFLCRLFRWWASKMIQLGLLPSPPDDYFNHEWIGDSRPWVDPEKELKAALIELDMGLTTLQILAKQRGYEFAQLVVQRSEERKLQADAKIPIVQSIATRPDGLPGGPQPAPAISEADAEEELVTNE